MTTYLMVAAACALALAGLAWFVWRGRSIEEDAHWAVKVVFAILLVAVPVCAAFAMLRLPAWASPSPATWNRPCFAYGFPVPSKFESAGGTRDFPGLLCLSWLFWTCFLMFLLGYRKWLSYLIAAALVATVSGLIFGGGLVCAAR